MLKLEHPPKAVALCILAVLCVVASWAASRSRFVQTLELKTVDARFRWLDNQGAASDDVVLVEIDNASIKSLEPVVGRWPWPRDVHALFLEYLERSEARLVVFDLLFLEKDLQNPDADQALADATRAAGNVVHSIYLGNQTTGGADLELLEANSLPVEGSFTSFTEADFPLEDSARAARSLGHVAMALDRDGPWRRYLLLAESGGRLIPSLALSAALASRRLGRDAIRIGERFVQGGGIDAPLDADWRLPIWFNGGPGTYSKFSYGQLFYSELQIQEGQSPDIDPSVFADKIVVVGVSAAGLHDLFTTPYSGGAVEESSFLGKMNGFEIHANVIDDLLANRYLLTLPGWLTWGLALLAALACLWLVLYCRLWVAIAALLALPGAYLVAAQLSFERHRQLPVSQILLSWAPAVVAGFAYQYWVESAAKRKVKKLFSRYVSPSVFRELLDNPEAALLEGRRQEATVLFSDLRGFTSISERLAPEALIEQLNEYFTAMVDEVFAHRGTVDKFVGDMIMAIFNAPIADPAHADQAVQCALAMQARIARLNSRWVAEDRPEFKSGVGINTGEMVVGNVGSQQMQSYTVIGDNVNLGARIESLTKEYGAEILISDSTRSRLTGSYSIEALGEATVKGKSQPVKIFRVALPS